MKLSLKITKRKFALFVVTIASLALISYGVWGLWDKHQVTGGPIPTIATKTVTHSTTEPEETKPDCDNHQVPSTEPRFIEIPSQGIGGCIQKVGIDQNNQIAAPANLHVAGWYTNSSLPGQKGMSLIDGHVSGKHSDAIFTHLKNTSAGDIIKIQFGDKTWKEFEIVDMKEHSFNEDVDEMLKPLDGHDSQLALITCGGHFDKAQQSYEKRLVVRSTLRSN